MNGAAISWDAVGLDDAPAIVLVHSLGTDRTMWAPQLDALRAEHRVVRVELPGHGRSPAPSAPCSLESIAGAVLRAVDEAGVERFHCCGVSLGGMVGLWLAAHHPERLLSLVAANTAARIGTAESWLERIRFVEASGLDALTESVIARWLAPRFVAEEPDRVEELRRVFRETAPEGYTACCAALAVADVTNDLGRIRTPTLVVAGRLDPATPVANSEKLHQAIRGSRLAIIEGASHLSNVDASGLFSGLVTDFLRERTAQP